MLLYFTPSLGCGNFMRENLLIQMQENLLPLIKTAKRYYNHLTRCASGSYLDEPASNIRSVNQPMHDIARFPGSNVDHYPRMLLNANAECFITGTNYQCNVPVSPISHGLNSTEIESDNLQVSYDSVLSECPLVQDIILNPDLTGDEGYAMGEVIYVSFIMTILILSSFIIWRLY